MIAVHEIMSASPVTVGPTTSVSELLALFDRHDFNAFPVVDGGRLLGIISKLDLLELFLSGDASTAVPTGDIGATRVEDLMHHEIVSVEPQASIAAAGAIMVGNNLRSLPVVERHDDRPMLVGMVSRGDVLRGLRFQLVEGSYVR
ncbi:MAG TPA: CBS domain-containing protein [Gemmatimonadales bacterium]|nr:CBS domain-containing protein [Gemmatimonadales bacterium]